MKDKKVIIYEVVTAVLALVSIFIVSIQFFNILIPENVLHTLIKIDDLIYVVFVIDYVTRLSLSKNKRDFIKNNKIDLISLIPFNAIFKSLRILKLNRLLKLGRLVKISVLFTRFKDDSKLFFKTNHFGYVLITTIILIFLGAIAMSYLENMDIGDSIWWSFVTTTSVGYGDIYPTTNLGRIIAILLMITGIITCEMTIPIMVPDTPNARNCNIYDVAISLPLYPIAFSVPSSFRSSSKVLRI